MTQFFHRYIYYSYKKMRFSNFVGERGDLILERNVFTKQALYLVQITRFNNDKSVSFVSYF